jgi:hypothetical protein
MQKWAAIVFLRPSVKSNVLFMTCLLKKCKKRKEVASVTSWLQIHQSMNGVCVLEVANI